MPRPGCSTYHRQSNLDRHQSRYPTGNRSTPIACWPAGRMRSRHPCNEASVHTTEHGGSPSIWLMPQTLLTVLTVKPLYRTSSVFVLASVAPALVNCYCSDAHLFVGGEVLFSSEGTTQGDPLAMAMFAIATIPLIDQLNESNSVNQVWFADDATAAVGHCGHSNSGGTNLSE